MSGEISETPNARAQRLNALARELPDPPEHLPEKEKRYMKAVREIYIRYTSRDHQGTGCSGTETVSVFSFAATE